MLLNESWMVFIWLEHFTNLLTTDYYKVESKQQKGGEKAGSKKKSAPKKKPAKGKKLDESGNYFDEDQFGGSDGTDQLNSIFINPLIY